MKTTVTEYDFRRAFETIRPDNFSYRGLGALYEYLTELEDGMGEEIGLDVIAICCDFSEYTMDELREDFGPYAGLDEEYTDEELIEYLRDNTRVIEVEAGEIYIVAGF